MNLKNVIKSRRISKFLKIEKMYIYHVCLCVFIRKTDPFKYILIYLYMLLLACLPIEENITKVLLFKSNTFV